MKKTIESAKDEVARKKDKVYINWKHFLEEFYFPNPERYDLDAMIDKAMELYHTRKCEEAGSGLPDNEAIKAICSTDETIEGFTTAQWMRSEAYKLLVPLQSQLEAKDKEIEELRKLILHRESQIEQYKLSFNHSESQLQEAKAEVERLKDKYEKPMNIPYTKYIP